MIFFQNSAANFLQQQLNGRNTGEKVSLPGFRSEDLLVVQPQSAPATAPARRTLQKPSHPIYSLRSFPAATILPATWQTCK